MNDQPIYYRRIEFADSRSGDVCFGGVWFRPVSGLIDRNTMTEERRTGIEVDAGNGPERPKWKRWVTEWEPDGVVDAVGEEEQ